MYEYVPPGPTDMVPCLLAYWQRRVVGQAGRDSRDREDVALLFYYYCMAWHGMASCGVVRCGVWCGSSMWHGIVNAEVSIKRNGPGKTRMQTGLKGMMMRLGSGSHYSVYSVKQVVGWATLCLSLSPSPSPVCGL
jgi:hypothetical protein